MIEFELPWPPTINTYYRVFRNRIIISKAGREYRKLVLLQRAKNPSPKILSKVAVEIEAFRPDNRKRDLDNLLKPSIDALTHAETWEDDSQIVDLRIYWAEQKGGVLKVKVRQA
jgi:crossover junction endodeoxyribonuclease RusA